MCQNRDRSYQNARGTHPPRSRTLDDTPRRTVGPRERRGWLLAPSKEEPPRLTPSKISNLFHFKVPAPMDIRAKKSRRIYTVAYRTENGAYMGWTWRVTLLPTPIACDTCVLATSGTTHPLPGSRTHPRASLRDTDIHVRVVAKAAAPRDKFWESN